MALFTRELRVSNRGTREIALKRVRSTNMKLALSLILFIALVPAFTSNAAGQDPSDAAQSVATLQLQLIEVQAKEAELQARALQLDEDLKPENIERSLAGIGSTKPEDLRELRRRQLSIERESLRTQLKLLAKSRERLESVIRTAETQAYQIDGCAELLKQAGQRLLSDRTDSLPV